MQTTWKRPALIFGIRRMKQLGGLFPLPIRFPSISQKPAPKISKDIPKASEDLRRRGPVTSAGIVVRRAASLLSS